MKILRITIFAFGLAALSAAVLLGPPQSRSALPPVPTPTPSPCPHCLTDMFPANIPLNDLGQGTYYPTGLPTPSPGTTAVQGGLYPGGFNQRPVAHNNRGLNIAQTKIVPRKKDGTADPDGTDPTSAIVMISIGMCNTTKEFGGDLGIGAKYGFVGRTMGDVAHGGTPAPWKNPKLVVIDCAQSGQDGRKWAENTPPIGTPTPTCTPSHGGPTCTPNPWAELSYRLAHADDGNSYSTKQVQVVWLKEAMIDPETDLENGGGVWPTHANSLKGYLETILTTLSNPVYGFKNVQMVFLSPRTRAWTTNPDNDPNFTHSPEPAAYETGFADQWVIADQINIGGQGWPWLSWGPYLWANGEVERSDHLKWHCNYVTADCVHPVVDGVTKVVDQLLAFFKTDPVATPWFFKTPAVGETRPTFNPSPTPTTVTAGDLAGVNFHVSATPYPPATRIVEYVWTYDDGDYAYDTGNQPQTDVNKIFPASSRTNNPYQVHVTAIDDLGNAGFATIPVTVNPAPTPTPEPRQGAVKDTKHPGKISARAERVATQPVKSLGDQVMGTNP
jgi:hypothetical protein